ncbi:MAG: response regulator, partial [Burkholderiales bacterium]|nr:response regulator [Anaerolineae bacterium]
LHIRLSYPASSAQVQQPRIEPIIDQMLQQIRWQIQYHTTDSEQHLTIRAPQEGALLLLVDDNEGLVDLLNHYLDGAYRLVAVHNGDDGLRMARQLQPDVILLDLMMPGMDGWELLQRLRTSSDTQAIPVIICSVISDPELAYSLGASKCVPKPVTKDALLHALRELRI